MKNTILVTGGAGFLGSHLCERLLEDEDTVVVCMDNYFTGSKANVAHLLGNPRFELVRHDITDPFKMEVSQIYNLACPASPVHYQYNPVKTIQTSVLGTLNCLEVARKTGAVMFQASTSEIYGDPEVHPQTELYNGNVNCTGPRACYDEGKRCAETLCFDYKREAFCDVRVVRIFNTYGPRMMPDDGRVVSNLIVQALSNEPMTIYGDGSQTRSFCYVDDLIEGFIRLMASDISTPVNIGNPGEFTIKQLAEQVIELTGSSSTIEYNPLPKDDPTQRRPDITIANDCLDWQPNVQLREGLTKTIKYFKNIIKND